MKTKMMPAVLFGALAIAGGSANAVNVSLCAGETTVTMPNGDIVPMWGYASGGAMAGVCDGTITVPGPRIDVPVGDTVLNVTLTNTLPDMNGVATPTSLVIPGLRDAAMVPVFDTTAGVAPGLRRVRSFTHETSSAGGTAVYNWTGIAPGSYIYESGTHPAVQMQMGLYGAMVHDSAAGVAYAGVPYDNEVVLFYSEVDGPLHGNIAADLYGTDGVDDVVSSTVDYQPDHFLVNGKPYEAADPDLPAGLAGERTLLRMFNIGLFTHTPVLNNLRMELVARDAKPLPHNRNQNSATLNPGQTKDAIVIASADDRYAIYDGFGGLTDGVNLGDSGMLAFLAVGANGALPDAVTDSYTVAEGGTLVADGVGANPSGVLANDTVGAGTLDTTPVSGPARGTATLNASGTLNYTHDGSESVGDAFVYKIDNGALSDQATVNITITPVNDAPVAVADSAATDDQTPVVITVLTNDTDEENDLLSVFFGTVSVPAVNGTAVANLDGTITYTPTGTGPYVDSFTYEATDGSLNSVAATVTVNVAAFVNAAPLLGDDFSTTTRNSLGLVIDIFANDTDDGSAADPADFNGVVLDVGVIPGLGEVRILGRRQTDTGNPVPPGPGTILPAINGTNLVMYPPKATRFNGQAYYNGDGTVTYIPAPGFAGSDQFKYILIDDTGALSLKGKVKINVTP